MRLQVSVNNGVPVRASLQSEGWLSVHLNLSADKAEDSRLWVQAIDKSDQPNTTFSEWDIGTISVGDAVQIQVLEQGEADLPTEVKRTSESPNNLFSKIDQARELLSAIRVCDKELMTVLRRSKTVEPEDEFEKISRAIGEVIYEFDRCLIRPTVRRHPELADMLEES